MCAADDPALGCPVEYIDLRGTSIDNPAVCKYTGNRYYSKAFDFVHQAVLTVRLMDHTRRVVNGMSRPLDIA